jgi:rhamnosyl/mannosyltransferase
VLTDPSIRDKVRVIPLGICESSYPAEGDDSVFERLGISKIEPYFLFVGVLRYYKGLEFLVRAASQVQGMILIAGSGPESQGLRQLSNDLGLKNVLFAGQVTDAEKVSLLKSCRALVLPSHIRSEAFGVVLVEASMFGRPMVTCEIGTGTSFVNLDGETGLVVPPGNAHYLGEAMRNIEENRNFSDSLGRKARARYERLFSGPALGSAYSEVYQEALEA